MGRTLKRVPLDFDWPRNKVWHGYQNPHYQTCKVCDGSGSTPACQWLGSIANLILMCGEAAADPRELHPWLQTVPLHPGARPSPDMVLLTGGLAGRAPRPWGHDSSDRWAATKAIVKAAGLDPDTWGRCPACEGEGQDPAFQEAYEAWQSFDPPEGEGYQTWETTSEGAPVSPVFTSLEALCEWLESSGASWFGSKSASKEVWLNSLSGEGVSGLMVLEPGVGKLTVDGIEI